MINITLANHTFKIMNSFSLVEKLCRDYITDYPAEATISVGDAEIFAESTEGREWSKAYLESLAVYRKICEYLIDFNTILFHCSAIKMNDKAYLFTAPSGTGKSTHTRLWKEHFGKQITIINDDKPLVEINNDVPIVYGTPYGGKSMIQVNTYAQVAGIVILNQAKENKIIRLSEREAYPMLLNQSYRPGSIEKTFRVMELVKKLVRIPTFSLSCNISDEAVVTAFNALKDL